jgi:hypothetical protein
MRTLFTEGLYFREANEIFLNEFKSLLKKLYPNREFQKLSRQIQKISPFTRRVQKAKKNIF